MFSFKKSMDKIPAPEEFFLKTNLNRNFEISTEDYIDVLKIEFFQGALNAYCMECNEDSTFRCLARLPVIVEESNQGSYIYPKDLDTFLSYASAWFPNTNNVFQNATLSEHALRNRVFVIHFVCEKDNSHILSFVFCVQNCKIMKIGQHPSRIDLDVFKTIKYKSILGNEKLHELNQAIELNNHGISIGAYVYLQRVFEDLIDTARFEASKLPGWNEKKFHNAGIGEKITMLADYLPEGVVADHSIYSVLNKDIQFLSEAECAEYFIVLKNSIELILRAKLEKSKKREFS